MTVATCNAVLGCVICHGAWGGGPWSDLYNYTGTVYLEVPSNYDDAGYSWKTGDMSGIVRSAGYIDTSGVPANAVISQVKIKGDAKFALPSTNYTHYSVTTTVHAYMQFLRLSTIPTTNAQRYTYAKDALVAYGQLYVPTNMTSWTAFEVTLNDFVLGDIVKGAGAQTPFAIREIQDTSSTPLSDTGAVAFLNNIQLEVTYDTVPGALQVVTLPATEITKTTMTINGEITAGSACKRGFDWGEGTAMDNEWYESGTFGIGEFSRGITGLTEATRYCFRAKGEETSL